MLIIPAIDLQNGQAVRLYQGDYSQKTVYSSDPVAIALGFQKMGAKYLHLVDLDGAKDGNTANIETIRKIREAIDIPIQLGGGIRNAETVAMYLNDIKINRVILGTIAITDPTFVQKMLAAHGAEKIVVGVDVRHGKVSTAGWREDSTVDYLQFIESLKNMGVKYIVATDIIKDGSLTSPNWEMYEKIKGINFVVSGGVSCEADVERAGDYYAVIVGKAYYEGKLDLEHLLKKAAVAKQAAVPLSGGSGSGIHSRCSGGVWGSAPLNKKRVIPCLDIKNGSVVKGINFVNLTNVGDPVAISRNYQEQGADEIVFLDISAENREAFYDLIRRTTSELSVPITVGGGIRSIEDFRKIFACGASKASVSTAAVANPELIKEASDEFGKHRIVVAIDAKKVGESNKYHVFVKGGREDTGLDLIEWAKKCEALGAGEILLTSMDGDGTESGYDIVMTGALVKSVGIPIIASGGCGKVEDIIEVFKQTDCSAALAASLFHYGKATVGDVKAEMERHGVKCERSELQLLSSKYFCLPQGGIHRRSRRCDSIGPPGQFCEAKREGLCPTERNRMKIEGLMPAIVQDFYTGRVLMLAYVNQESYDFMLKNNETCFWSRSRQALWHKGSTSGDIQKIKHMAFDCDNDTLLIQVEQTGNGTCHTGSYSCFGEEKGEFNILDKIYAQIKDRSLHPQEKSYTNYLLDNGVDKICKKVGEEAAETIIAAKNKNKGELSEEVSDLLYHLMVLMFEQGVTMGDIQAKLSGRHSRS